MNILYRLCQICQHLNFFTITEMDVNHRSEFLFSVQGHYNQTIFVEMLLEIV